MNNDKKTLKPGFFETFSAGVTRVTGSTAGFIIAFTLVLLWVATGPLFNFSETWQMIITTGTSTITFLMVFLIQKSQNKDSLAIQLKLNELVSAHESASNKLVNVENMTEDELKVIQKYYSRLRDFIQKEESSRNSNQLDQAYAIKEEMERELKDKLKNANE